jgi:uncharacterized protein
MDWILFGLSFLLIFSGIMGAFLPILPGPPLAWLGILALHFAQPWTGEFLVLSFVAMVVVTAMDYVVPIWGTKKLGGTVYGTRGATLGLIVGLLFLPLGLILGPFLGAFIGELYVNRNDTPRAWRSAFGALLGFLAGTMIKLIFGLAMMYYWIAAIF